MRACVGMTILSFAKRGLIRLTDLERNRPRSRAILLSAGWYATCSYSPPMTARRVAPGSLRHRAGRKAGMVVVPVTGTALLLIDVVNDLDFPGSEVLVEQAEPMALRLAALKRRASAAGIPSIYIIENLGQRHSDFRRTVAHRIRRASRAGRCDDGCVRRARLLRAEAKHSGFFETTLDTLLEGAADRRRS